MASQTIKGLTVQIGGDTTKFGAAVKSAEDKSKSLGRELADVNKLLKLDPENVDLLAQKQQILTDRVAATKEKLDILKEAEAQVQAQFEKGDITAEQYRAFQREIQYTSNEMQGYEKSIDKTNQRLTEARLKTGEEANSLEELRTKISLQEQGLTELANQYKSAVIAEGESSETAQELKDKYNQLNSELSESKQKMADAETAAASLGQAEETALSPVDSLKKKISEQEKELSSMKDEYKNVVMEQGKDSDAAKQLENRFNALNQELQDNRQKLNDVEQEANQLGQAEENALTPLESLKKTLSDQEQELDRLNTEYQNAVVQYGKNSAKAKSLASQIKTLSDEHKEQKKRLEEAEKATEDITATEKTLTEQYKDQKSELDDLKKQYVNVAAQYGTNSKEAKALAKQIDSLSGELAEEDKKIKDAEKSADTFDKTLSDTSDDAGTASKNVKDLGDSAKNAEGGFNAATIAVGNFMANLAIDLLRNAVEVLKQFVTGTVETGKTFEASMSKVAAISGATTEQLADLDAVARQYGRDTQYSASECADALSYMALAGWDVESMTAGLPGVLNLAAASEMDLAQASDIVTDYMTAFGWEANRAGEFADKMAFAMAHSNTDTQMLGEAYKNCASTAESLHYSMEETTAAIMTMANAGVKGGEAGTALNAVMTRLATDTKGCASELKQYGIDIYDSEGNMQSLSSILTGISETWGTLTDEQQANLAKMIAGQQQYSSFQTIMKGLSDTAKENGQSFEDYTEALRNCDGTASAMAETMTDNLRGDLKKLESAFQDLQLSIYDGANQPMRNVIQTITGGLIPALSDLVKGVDGAESQVGTALSGLLSTIMNEISGLLPKAAEILGTVAMSLVESLPQIADNLGNVAFSLIEDLIDALPSVLPRIYQTIRRLWTQLFNSVERLTSDAKELIQIIGTALMNELPKIGTMLVSEFRTIASEWIPVLVETLPELLSTLLNLITQSIPTILTTLKSVLQSVLSALIPVISELIPNLVSTIAEFLNEGIPLLLNAAVELFSVILQALPDLITALAEALPDIIATIIDCLLTNIPVVLDTATTLLMAVVDALPQILEALTTALPQIVEKLIDFFTSEDNLEKVLDSAFTLLSAMLDCIPDVISQLVLATADIVMAILTAIGEKLPDMAQKGAELFESLIEKGTEIIQKVVMFVPELITSIVGAISDHFQDLQDAGMNMFNQIGEGIKNMISGAYNWGADLIDNFVSGVFGGENEITKAAENIGEKIWEYLHFSEPEKGKLADFSTYAPDMMRTFAEGISENAQLVINQLVNFSDTMAEKSKEVGQNFIDGISPLLNLLPENISTSLTATVSGVSEWGKELKEKAVSAVSDVISTVKNTTGSLPDKAIALGKAVIQKLWDGISNSVKVIFNGLLDFTDTLFDMAEIAGEFFLDGITPLISLLPESMQTVLNTTISNVAEWGKNLKQKAVSAISDIVNTVNSTTGSLPDKALTLGKAVMQKLWGGISETTLLVINGIKQFSDDMSDKAKDTGRRFLEGIQNFAKLLPGNMGNYLLETINRVISWGRDLKQKADAAVADMVSTIENRLRSLPDKMTEVGRNLVQGLWNGIQGMKDWIYSQVSGFCDNILNSIYSVFDIHSPAGTTEYAGKMLDYGFVSGIDKNSEEPVKAIRRLAADLMDETAVIPERLEVQQSYQMPPVAQTSGLESTLSAQLGEILQAIKAGQVLMLDGNKLVGGTADKMNTALGQIQAISIRR